MGSESSAHTISVADRRVSALLIRPTGARVLLVLGHGAGAGMRHPFMAAIADRLGAEGIATLRYQFPYMESGLSRTDTPAVAMATVRAACAEAARLAGELPRIAGGKSFGGRMTSSAQAESPLAGVRGLVFLGFPLHPPGRPGTSRAEHLDRVTVPMLFLQGTRDDFADLELTRGVTARLGPRATLHVVDGADHSFGVLKRSGRTADQVLAELARVMAGWIDELLQPAGRCRGDASIQPR
jgi:predicted alpha/beta-hydrolase family hydrolase